MPLVEITMRQCIYAGSTSGRPRPPCSS